MVEKKHSTGEHAVRSGVFPLLSCQTCPLIISLVYFCLSLCDIPDLLCVLHFGDA